MNYKWFFHSFQIVTDVNTEENINNEKQHSATETPSRPNATKPVPTDKSDTLKADNIMTVFKTLLSTGKVSWEMNYIKYFNVRWNYGGGLLGDKPELSVQCVVTHNSQ